MDLLNLISKRRSVREYTTNEIAILPIGYLAKEEDEVSNRKSIQEIIEII